MICLLFFGLTAWAFAPALKTNFQIFDESGELFLNPHMNSGLGWQNLRWALFSLEYSNWYPLTWISHMLDFKMFGINPWGHHLTSVLLHAANGVLLFLVLKRMTGALWRSLIVAGLFALHPLRVESVAWISERKDVLSAFFGLLALWTYARFAEASRTPGGRPKLFYGLTLLFFALGLMSKSMLVTFPCLLLLLDFWPLERWRRQGWWSLVMEKVPFFLLVVPVSIAAYFAQKGGGQFLLRFPLGFRLETALMGYARYLGKMFWPANFSVLYPYPDYWPASELLCAAALILGMSVARLCFAAAAALFIGWLVVVSGNAGAGDWPDTAGGAIHEQSLHLPADDRDIVAFSLGGQRFVKTVAAANRPYGNRCRGDSGRVHIKNARRNCLLEERRDSLEPGHRRHEK